MPLQNKIGGRLKILPLFYCFRAIFPAMKLPCIILVRAGSRRLPNKWALPWRGTTLLRWAIAQAVKCEHVSKVIVGTDSQEIIDHVNGVCKAKVPEDGRDYAPLDHLRMLDTFKDSVSAELVGHYHTCVRRDPVADDQTSLDGVRDVQARANLEASYVLLVQSTSPTLTAEDLSRLVLTADLPTTEVWALGVKGKPSGAAWLLPPWLNHTRPDRIVEQDAPLCDIDTADQYEEARARWEK